MPRIFEVESFKAINGVLYVAKRTIHVTTYRQLFDKNGKPFAYLGLPIHEDARLRYKWATYTESVWKNERKNINKLNGTIRRIIDLHNGREIYNYA